ncbi:Coproporphyrinogen oxidase [Atractiella rhizophila]|nr:Coproporphyrinogen oxidase [Atractiella rhizophila]
MAESTTQQPTIFRDRVVSYIRDLQNRIVEGIEAVEGGEKKFFRDAWTRPNGGGEGISCVLQDATVFEKAGCNISIIHSELSPAAVKQMRADHGSRFDWYDGETRLPYFVVGLSIVFHPRNPMAPTVHANYRYFEVTDPGVAPAEDGSRPVKSWWFGGGSDLTPSYLFEEDAVHFHKTLKDACDAHDPTYYPTFKATCDKYFYIPHREECRGIGGIFFDDVADKDPSEIFAFIQSAGNAFLESYVPIVEKRKDMAFTERNKQWQQLRRGRYVEFNLVHDRGTKFGLLTPGARIESILMTMPLTARWEYMAELGTEEGTEENKLLSILRQPKDWIN